MELKKMIGTIRTQAQELANSDASKAVVAATGKVVGEAAVVGYSVLSGVPTLIAGVMTTVDDTYNVIEEEYKKAKSRK